MIKAATGDYRKFVQQMEEDVVIMGHTHKAEIRKYRNYQGNQVIYANTGCWTAHGKEVGNGMARLDFLVAFPQSLI